MADSMSDYVFKVVVIGDLDVGKSSLIRRFHEDIFEAKLCTTIGVDFFVHNLEINDKNVTLHLWDTAGQERYRTMTTSYFRGANGALIVFDLTSKKSFQAIKDYWLNEFSRASGSEAIVILVGNKSDMEEEREVTIEEIKEFCSLYSMSWVETSAKDSNNVQETFETLAKKLVENCDELRSLPPSYYSGPSSFTLHGAYGVPEQSDNSYWNYCSCTGS